MHRSMNPNLARNSSNLHQFSIGRRLNIALCVLACLLRKSFSNLRRDSKTKTDLTVFCCSDFIRSGAIKIYSRGEQSHHLLRMCDIQNSGGTRPSVSTLAQREAYNANCGRVCTPHIFLALFQHSDSIARQVLKMHSVTRRRFEDALNRLSFNEQQEEHHAVSAKRIASAKEHGHLLASRQAEEVFHNVSFDVIKSLDHRVLNTGHVLLGILQVHDGVGVSVLRELGIELEKLRASVIAALQDVENP